MRGQGGDLLVRQAPCHHLHDGMDPHSALVSVQGYHEVIERPSRYRRDSFIGPVRPVAGGAFARKVGAVFGISRDGEDLRVEAVFLGRRGRLRRRQIGAVAGKAPQPCEQRRPVVRPPPCRRSSCASGGTKACGSAKNRSSVAWLQTRPSRTGRLHRRRVAKVRERAGRPAEDIVEVRADPMRRAAAPLGGSACTGRRVPCRAQARHSRRRQPGKPAAAPRRARHAAMPVFQNRRRPKALVHLNPLAEAVDGAVIVDPLELKLARLRDG